MQFTKIYLKIRITVDTTKNQQSNIIEGFLTFHILRKIFHSKKLKCTYFKFLETLCFFKKFKFFCNVWVCSKNPCNTQKTLLHLHCQAGIDHLNTCSSSRSRFYPGFYLSSEVLPRAQKNPRPLPPFLSSSTAHYVFF